MSYYDNDSTSVTRGSAGVERRDALVPANLGMGGSPLGMNGVGMNGRNNDVLHGGMDRSWFFHCLRRRWLLAMSMGTVVAGVAALLLLWFFPESHSATAAFKVAMSEPTVFEQDQGGDVRRFEIFQRTQKHLMKNDNVLTAALRDPQIAGLETLADEDDPVQWLEENLYVVTPEDSEIMQVSLTEENPEDIREIVNAVIQAYADEVLGADRKEKTTTKDILQTNLLRLKKEIDEKMESLIALQNELGVADPEGNDVRVRMLERELAQATNEYKDLRTKLTETGMQFEIERNRLKDPQLVEAQIDEAISGDPFLQQMQQQILMLDYQMTQIESTMKRGSAPQVKSLQKQMEDLQQKMAQYRAERKAEYMQQQQGQPNLELRYYTNAFQIARTYLGRQIVGLEQAIEEKKEILNSMSTKSVELESQRTELDQLKEISNDMALKIEASDVEAGAPARIKLLHPAVVRPGINAVQRYAIAGFGASSAFALTCLGIAFLEFRNRRLNGADQVDEGLGIRVIGTLPSLSSRQMLNPNNPVVAQLTESIDGVRTLLTHDSSRKERKIILVTSGATLEGRTIVASQLAASLARSGRRTLLIDGDLRRPAQHGLFDMPLEDGLCEVLRAELDVADAVRPTHADGLYLLTAGYCDADAIQALATDQIQPVFEKLRSEFDFVIIDGAPVIGLSDSLLLGQHCDGAILSVLRDHSEVPKVHKAAELLHSVGIRILGSVVNGVPAKSDRRVTQMQLAPPKADRQQIEAS